MTGARLAGFWIILLKLHDYCCNIFVSLMRLGSMSRVGLRDLVREPTHEAHALLDRILPYVVDLERRLEMASRAVKATSGDVVLKVRCSHSRTSASCRAGSAPHPPSSNAIP